MTGRLERAGWLDGFVLAPFVFDGLQAKLGSWWPRSMTGASECFTKVSPPSSLMASPTVFLKGTVIPRFQPV